MKKVFDWTVGSFFRTIGRIIAFIVIGYLVATLLSNNGFQLSELFFTKVHASSSEGVWISSAQYKIGDNGTYQNASFYNNHSHGFIGNLNGTQTYYIKFNSQKQLPNNAGELLFTINFDILSNDSSTTTENQYKCTIADTDWEHVYSGQHDWEYEYTSFTCAQHTSTTQYIENKFSLSIAYLYNNNDGLQAPCYAVANSGDAYSFRCPVTTSNVHGIAILLNTNREMNFSVSINYLYTITYDYNKTIVEQQNQTNQAITNQTQQQQQQHEEMMDSNTTQAEDEATSFFEDFEVPDVGGLSAIITAPLSTIQSLLNSTCTNLVLPLPFVDEDLTLPCLNSIYTEHFGLFFTLYQTIILAIVSYRCIRSIFFDIHGFTNPSDDRIEVMDL